MNKLALISLAAGAALLPTAALADPSHPGPMKVERHHQGRVMTHHGPVMVAPGPGVMVHHSPYPAPGAYPPPLPYEDDWDEAYGDDNPYDEDYDGGYEGDYDDYDGDYPPPPPPPPPQGYGGYGGYGGYAPYGYGYGYGYAPGGMITVTETTTTTYGCGCHETKKHWKPRKRGKYVPRHRGERG
jgi:hypothetical protein